MKEDTNLSVEEQLIVYQSYLGSIELGTARRSPFRPDNTPSFNVYSSEDENKILFKDFGAAVSGDVYSFIQQMSGVNTSFPKAVKIAKERIKNFNNSYSASSVLTTTKKKATPTIQYRTSYTYYEINYWKRFGINVGQLKHNRVFPLKSLAWGNFKTNITSTPFCPTFVYLLNSDATSWKIYRPLITKESKLKKWITHETSKVIAEGYDLLERNGGDLIICSGTKDRMVVNNCGYQSINPTAESSYKSLVRNKEEVENGFNNVYICFDGDDAGLKSAQILSNKTGWKVLELDYPNDCKDVADVVEKYNLETLKKLIKDKIC